MKNFPLMTAFANGVMAIQQNNPQKLATSLDELGFKKDPRSNWLSPFSKVLCQSLFHEAASFKTKNEIFTVLIEHTSHWLDLFSVAKAISHILIISEEERLSRDLMPPKILSIYDDTSSDLIATLTKDEFRQLIAFLSSDAISTIEFAKIIFQISECRGDAYVAMTEEIIKYMHKHEPEHTRMLLNNVRDCLLYPDSNFGYDEYRLLVKMFADAPSLHKNPEEEVIGHA